MTEIHVAVVDGQYRCYRTVTGTDREYFGPRFAGPRLAGQYADLAAGRPISPLRVSRSASDATSGRVSVPGQTGTLEVPLPPDASG